MPYSNRLHVMIIQISESMIRFENNIIGKTL